MANVSQCTRPDDRHFLRTDLESDAGRHSAKPHGSPSPGPALAATLWPLPKEVGALTDAMNQWNRFAVLAVQIDPPIQAQMPQGLHACLLNLFTQLADRHDGKWFAWQMHSYGVLLPGVNATAALSLAKTLQTDLAAKHVETISIGITEFPLHHFDHTQSLINACKALDHGVFFGPNACVIFDAISLNISGDRFYQAHDPDSAIHEYRMALELDGANINARNSLGVCLAEKGALADARSEFEAVCRIHPQDGLALFNLGLIDLQQERPDQAKTYFEKAYQADTQTFDIPYQLGKLLFDQEEAAQALGYLEAAAKIRESYSPLFALMGQCLNQLGQINPAIAAYKKAIKLNPNDAVSLSDLGTLYALRGENPEICITFCRQSVLIAPQNSLFHYRLAKLYHAGHQWDQALVEYKKAAELGYQAGDEITEIRNRLAADPDENICCA